MFECLCWLVVTLMKAHDQLAAKHVTFARCHKALCLSANITGRVCARLCVWSGKCSLFLAELPYSFELVLRAGTSLSTAILSSNYSTASVLRKY